MRIQEMAAKYGLTTYSLRFYERKGLLHPGRDSRGDRDYTQEDLAALDRIVLYRRAGLSVEQIQTIFAGMETTEMIALLTKTRAQVVDQLAEMQETLAFLTAKIAHEQQRLSAGGQHIPTPAEDAALGLPKDVSGNEVDRH
ncbi:MerR family transcriptional regulator [Lacticaseibacillus yichunensis]|uniref:MerR family transcriptional regulator n=1 Tax=Lacticaseibacillus yichunensis TaxID=2486015 RepID=A0ABW4CN87_9LACO|nr:MerR family transcriptional regulator [Lacticaseibacillus yichunensis]